MNIFRFPATKSKIVKMEEGQSLISKMDLVQILIDANVPRNTKEIFAINLVNEKQIQLIQYKISLIIFNNAGNKQAVNLTRIENIFLERANI